MLNISLNHVVNKIVQHELIKKGGRQGEALHLHFDLRLMYYARNKEYYQSRGLHLLYHLRPHCSYVDVFSAQTDSSFAKIHEVKEWKHESSHDTCWRDISCFSNVYFEMANQINESLKADHRKQVPPKNMTEHNDFALFAEMYRWVPVEITKKDPSDLYSRKVVVLK